MNKALESYINNELKPFLTKRGFEKVSSKNDMYNLAYELKNVSVILDMDYNNKECWLYIKKNDKFIYRKLVTKKQDLKPVIKITCT